MIAFADYEENKSLIEQEVNAYIIARAKASLALLSLEQDTNAARAKGKHHRLLLLAAPPTIQAEYWPKRA